MTQQQVIAVFYAAVQVCIGAWYLYGTSTSPTKPVLASWLIFFLASSISLYTYVVNRRRQGERPDYAANITNVTSVPMSGVVVLVLWARQAKFIENSMQVVCLVFVGLIMIYYFMARRQGSNKEVQANVALNFVMAIAYVPMLIRLWTADQNTESFVFWGVGLVTNGMALYGPIRDKNRLATLYGIRSVVMIALLLVLMTRLWWTGR